MIMQFWTKSDNPYAENPTTLNTISILDFAITRLDGFNVADINYTKVLGRSVGIKVGGYLCGDFFIDRIVANPVIILDRLPQYLDVRVIIYDDLGNIYIDGLISRLSVLYNKDELLTFNISDLFSVFVDYLSVTLKMIIDPDGLYWNTRRLLPYGVLYFEQQGDDYWYNDGIVTDRNAYYINDLLEFFKNYNGFLSIMYYHPEFVFNTVRSIVIYDQQSQGLYITFSSENRNQSQMHMHSKIGSKYNSGLDIYYVPIIWMYTDDLSENVILVPTIYKFDSTGVSSRLFIDLNVSGLTQQLVNNQLQYDTQDYTVELLYAFCEQRITLLLGDGIVYTNFTLNEYSYSIPTLHMRFIDLNVSFSIAYLVAPTPQYDLYQLNFNLSYTMVGDFTFLRLFLEDTIEGEKLIEPKELLELLLVLCDGALVFQNNKFQLLDKSISLIHENYLISEYLNLVKGIRLRNPNKDLSYMFPVRGFNISNSGQILQKYYLTVVNLVYKLVVVLITHLYHEYKIGDIVRVNLLNYKLFGLDYYEGKYKLKLYGTSYNI